MEELNLEYQIAEYDSAPEVLKQVNILLLDIEMDGMSGTDLKDWLQKSADIRIKTVSGDVFVDMEEIAYACAWNTYTVYKKGRRT